jgi:hypothetical protein
MPTGNDRRKRRGKIRLFEQTQKLDVRAWRYVMPLEVAAFVTPTIINRVTDCQSAMHNVANCAKVSKKRNLL